MALLSLGDLELDGFEVPANVKFGGAQRATVHKLLGGGRVIDCMGGDDRALAWSGVLSGSSAAERARVLDAMRVAGLVLPLSWDAFCYDVVITSLDLEFCTPWWITYTVECTVLTDLAQAVIRDALDLSGSILGDLGAAAGIVDVAGIMTSLASPNLSLGVGAPTSATVIHLAAVQRSIGIGITASEQGLETADVTSLVASSGSLAQLCHAQGYIERSLSSLEGVLD